MDRPLSPSPRRISDPWCRALLLAALLWAATCAAAEPPPAAVDDGADGMELPLPAWVDRFQSHATLSLIQLSERLDSFFPTPDNRRYDYDKTRLEARFGLQLAAERQAIILKKLDGRIALPRLEERLSLFVTEENPENGVEEPRNLFIPRQIDTDLHFGLTTGLRIRLSRGERHLLQDRIGARLYPDWQRFNELGGFLFIPLGNFLFKPGQIIFWRERQGYGDTLLVDLDRPLGERFLLRLHSEGTASETSSGVEYRQALYFFHQITPKKGYSLVVQGSGATFPHNRFEEYLAGIDWKQRIHKRWLYFETGLHLFFRREDDFEVRPSVYVALTAHLREHD